MSVVVVTGASSGIGRAIARAFGARRDQVALIARGREGLEAAAREIRAAGGEALALPCDVSNRVMLDALADQVVKHWGRIDVWVNDAMVSVLGPATELTADELQRVTDVNYLGTVYGTLAALRHMRRRNAGTIIQVGSLLAYRSIPMQSAYCATKAAVRAFTDSLRSELADEQSKVNLCHLLVPATNTPQFDVIKNKLGGHAHPMGGVVYQPEVIADAALYVAGHPVRELMIGPKTVQGFFGQVFAPGLLDRFLGKNAKTAQITHALPPQRRDNLDRPLHEDLGAHGSFDDEARGSSVQLWTRMHARPVAATVLSALSAAFLFWRWRRTA